MNNNEGFIVVISSPSGGGKTTVIKKLLQKKDRPYIYSISMTTRKPRPGERDGKDYWFVSPEEFQQHIEQGDLVEYEKVHDHFYGTPKKPLQKWIAEGRIVLMDLDVFGAMEIKKLFPKNSLLIFLKPPNVEVLKERLSKRATEGSEELARRLARVDTELKYADKFDEIVINDDLDKTVKKVDKLIFGGT